MIIILMKYDKWITKWPRLTPSTWFRALESNSRLVSGYWPIISTMQIRLVYHSRYIVSLWLTPFCCGYKLVSSWLGILEHLLSCWGRLVRDFDLAYLSWNYFWVSVVKHLIWLKLVITLLPMWKTANSKSLLFGRIWIWFSSWSQHCLHC